MSTTPGLTALWFRHKNLDTLIQYSQEQGFIGGKMALEELCAEIGQD